MPWSEQIRTVRTITEIWIAIIGMRAIPIDQWVAVNTYAYVS